MSQFSFLTFLPAVAFVLFLLLQTCLPRRDIDNGFSLSWNNRSLHNYLLFFINTILFRWLIPLTLIGVSVWASGVNAGLFNWLPVNSWLAAVVCVIVLDFAVYWQHVATHKIDFLWRFHQVHHADKQMDVTTALRFHPIELLLSLLYKSLIVVILGAPIIAVIIFELLLFIGPAFNHSNWALPNRIDKLLRWVIATPDVHRTHHSIDRNEQDTNYGFFIIWWDRLFNTYTVSPQEGHKKMRIGLKDQSQEQSIEITKLLTMPFKSL